MSDERTRSTSWRGASWNSTLTDRQRVLLHTQPLLMLRHNWSLRDEECQRYDPLCLSMKLFDVVIDHSGFGDEVVRDTVHDQLAPLLESIDEASGILFDAGRHRRVVERLIGDLLNDSQRGESFSVEYSDFDNHGLARRLTLSFKLLKEVHGYSGDIALQMSSEAINLFLNALDLDIESEQIANEAVVQFQLERGHFDKARAGAEAARGRSIQYEQKIQRVIEQTRRDIRHVDWRHDVHQMIVEANEHVELRLLHEEGILRSAREKLTSLADEDENRKSLSAVVRLIDDCRSRHLRLNKRLMSARGEFIEQQARQCFIEQFHVEPINLRDQVLAPLLSVVGSCVSDLTNDVAHAFIGPVTPRVISLRDLVVWQLQPKRIQTSGEAPLEEVEAVETNVEAQRFDDEAWSGCEKIMADLAGMTRLSAVLGQLELDGCPAAVQDAVTLRLLEHFDLEEDLETALFRIEVAEIDGLNTARCAGDDLLIEVALSSAEV